MFVPSCRQHAATLVSHLHKTYLCGCWQAACQAIQPGARKPADSALNIRVDVRAAHIPAKHDAANTWRCSICAQLTGGAVLVQHPVAVPIQGWPACGRPSRRPSSIQCYKHSAERQSRCWHFVGVTKTRVLQRMPSTALHCTHWACSPCCM